jgi:hypothetical protein
VGPEPDPHEDSHEDLDPPGAPRWVKVSAVLVLLIIAVAVLVAAIAGDHGPMRHSAPTAVADLD